MVDSLRKFEQKYKIKWKIQTIKAIEDLLIRDDALTTKEMAKRMQKYGFNVSHSRIYRYLIDNYEYREVDESKVLTEDQKKLLSNIARDFFKYDRENVIFTDEVIFRLKKIENYR